MFIKRSALLNLFVLTPVFAGVALSFQNCSPVVFQEVNLASTQSSLALCDQNPSDPQCVVATPPKCKFNGLDYSEGDVVTAYLNSTVATGGTCTSEERKCKNGIFTGSYLYATCSVNQPAACLFNGKTIPNGGTVRAYRTSSVAYGQTCTSETRKCTAGVLSGSYSFETCAPGVPASCLFDGKTVAHGATVIGYTNSTVPFGSTCQAVNRTCINGALSGSGAFASCSVNAAASCLFDGRSIPHNGSVNAYQNSSVAYGSTCVSQNRICTNGSLSGSYSFASCTVGTPRSCLFNGNSIAHGQDVIAYISSSVPYGQSCLSQSRVCNDGALSGSYLYATCSVGTAPNSCIFDGKTVAHGQSVTAYQSSVTPPGGSCTSEVRICNNSSLSGSYLYGSCTPSANASCLLAGQTFSHGQSVIAYSSSSVPFGQTCSSATRVCNNGTFSGSASYQYLSCSVSDPAPCSYPGGLLSWGSGNACSANAPALTLAHGATRSFNSETSLGRGSITYSCTNGAFQVASQSCTAVVHSTGQHCDIGGSWGWRANETSCPTGTYPTRPSSAGGCPAGWTQHQDIGCFVDLKNSLRIANCPAPGGNNNGDECCMVMCSATSSPSWTCNRDYINSGGGEGGESVPGNSCTCTDLFGRQTTVAYTVTSPATCAVWSGGGDAGEYCSRWTPEVGSCGTPAN